MLHITYKKMCLTLVVVGSLRNVGVYESVAVVPGLGVVVGVTAFRREDTALFMAGKKDVDRFVKVSIDGLLVLELVVFVF